MRDMELLRRTLVKLDAALAKYELLGVLNDFKDDVHHNHNRARQLKMDKCRSRVLKKNSGVFGRSFRKLARRVFETAGVNQSLYTHFAVNYMEGGHNPFTPHKDKKNKDGTLSYIVG